MASRRVAAKPKDTARRTPGKGAARQAVARQASGRAGKASARRPRAPAAPVRTAARRGKPAAAQATAPARRPTPAARARVRPQQPRGVALLVRPQKPDSALAALIGSAPLPRTQAIRKVWSYIRKNGLQDTQNRRMINPDERLRRVFGNQKQVSMFEMAGLMKRHLTS